jgi:hypothetical protein
VTIAFQFVKAALALPTKSAPVAKAAFIYIKPNVLFNA